MVAFVDAHRGTYGVEPICAQLPIAPSTYSAAKAVEAEPTRAASRVQREAVFLSAIQQVWHAERRLHGARRIWKALHRQQMPVARCMVERLMRRAGLRSVRGRRLRTTAPAPVSERPLDLLHRDLRATPPNRL